MRNEYRTACDVDDRFIVLISYWKLLLFWPDHPSQRNSQFDTSSNPKGYLHPACALGNETTGDCSNQYAKESADPSVPLHVLADTSEKLWICADIMKHGCQDDSGYF